MKSGNYVGASRSVTRRRVGKDRGGSQPSENTKSFQGHVMCWNVLYIPTSFDVSSDLFQFKVMQKVL